MAESVSREVFIAVLGAAAVGIATLTWNWASSGGVIRALGGITRADLDDALKSSAPSTPLQSASGSIPSGAIIAATTECQNLPGNWDVFLEGQGRFLIGAGSNTQPSYMSWTPEGGIPTKLSQYNKFDMGGEERHLIKLTEAPQVIPHQRGDYGGNHDTGGTQWVEIKQQTATMNVLPPYVGVFFCKKK